jgi:hypothetical protein
MNDCAFPSDTRASAVITRISGGGRGFVSKSAVVVQKTTTSRRKWKENHQRRENP